MRGLGNRLAVAVLAALSLAGCGGGGGGGGGTTPPPVDPPPAPLPQYTLTPNHRWGLFNGGVPTVAWVDVNQFDPPGTWIMQVRPPAFGAGVLWEASEAESLPPGKYRLSYMLLGWPDMQVVDFDYLPGVRDAWIIRYPNAGQ